MDITIQPHKLQGSIDAIPSKSQAHRLLICAAFSDGPTHLICPQTNQDIEATAECLTQLGARICRTQDGYFVEPIREIPKETVVNCRESGSTLRFLLPIAGALGVDCTFLMSGRLPQRPLSPMWEEMERMGCCLTRPDATSVRCTGKLRSGAYQIDGGISSQFITGFLLALSLVDGPSTLQITGKIESLPYIQMTLRAMERFGVRIQDYKIPGNAHYCSPRELVVEGDWSNAAFFLAAKALGSDLQVGNLLPDSPQGDRAVVELLAALEQSCSIDASDIPDLVPILAVVAGAKQGASFRNIQRLRLKESDRVASVIAMLEAIGGKALATEDTLTVLGTGYRGGVIDSAGDHRIAMAGSVAATVCTDPVTILGAQCVSKSYPDFWEDYRRLGGKI